MDQKSERKLDSLPSSNDPFWAEAEVYIPERKPRDERCEHHFVHRTAQEVICKKCNVGYFLSEGMIVRDGHIRLEDEVADVLVI